MKHLKFFEAWAGKPLPVAPLHLFLNYYNCGECNALYKTEKKISKCPNCNHSIEPIAKKSWESELKSRLDENEWKEYLMDEEEFKDEIIPLDMLDNDYDENLN